MRHPAKTSLVLFVAATWLVTAAAVSAGADGRYKKEGDKCVWVADESGPNQCTPPKGRYKKDGNNCAWDANDSGPDQCKPPKGRFKRDGDRCVWDANDSGTDQCRPIQPRS